MNYKWVLVLYGLIFFAGFGLMCYLFWLFLVELAIVWAGWGAW